MSSKNCSTSSPDWLDEQSYRRSTRKRLIIITISTIILISTIVGAIVTTKGNSNTKALPPPNFSSSESIKIVCNVTLYPDYCSSSMMSASLKSNTSSNSNSDRKLKPADYFKLSMEVAVDELTEFVSFISSKLGQTDGTTNDPLLNRALLNCKTLVSDSVYHLEKSKTVIQVGQGKEFKLSASEINDIRTWLTASITDQETCVDGLTETANHTIIVSEVRSAMRNSTMLTSNCLAIVSNALTIVDRLNLGIHRKLLTVDDGDGDGDGGYPRWVLGGERRLLGDEVMKPNLTVAKDGSGDFVNISDAVDSIRNNSMYRFVIYVKEGVYVENVYIGTDKWNVMMYGDGMNKSVVSGSLNRVDGVPTFSTGTLIVVGKGFIAKDMGFWNTAGPEKEQAVAVRSSSDRSAFYRCSFNGYQDTLYTYSNRQFYRECQVIGTIDFIFGNAAVVFQNCTIQPRKPKPGQFNTITAQSKTDPNQNSGISIQRSQITPFDNLTGTMTYLGRPWKDYATTVFMESDLGDFVNREGWTEWVVNVEPASTIFYAEYMNSGPGSVVGQRVKWAGVKPKLTEDEAKKFTVDSFIQGSEWLPKTNVMYDGSLLQ